MDDRAARFNQALIIVDRMIRIIQADMSAAPNLPDIDHSQYGSLAVLPASGLLGGRRFNVSGSFYSVFF